MGQRLGSVQWELHLPRCFHRQPTFSKWAEHVEDCVFRSFVFVSRTAAAQTSEHNLVEWSEQSREQDSTLTQGGKRHTCRLPCIGFATWTKFRHLRSEVGKFCVNEKDQFWVNISNRGSSINGCSQNGSFYFRIIVDLLRKNLLRFVLCTSVLNRNNRL